MGSKTINLLFTILGAQPRPRLSNNRLIDYELVGVAYCGTMLETALTKESGFRPISRKVVM